MNKEIWKDIEGYQNKFAVSNLGRVKSKARVVNNHTGVIHKPERILKQGFNKKGYPVVYLDDNGTTKMRCVHRLVAIAFIDNPENKPQVNHIDGIKIHSYASNLEWCTNLENQRHARKLGLVKNHGKAGRPKRAVLQIDIETKEIINRYPSVSAAGKALKMKSYSNIGACCRQMYGKRTAYGYEWAYESEVME